MWVLPGRALALRAATAVALAGLLGGVGLASSPQQVAPAPAPVGDPELGPLVSGQTSYVDGTHVWTGYAYNDKGANSSPGGPGAATYPASSPNAANLIQLQLGSVPGGTRVTALLETLVDPSLPLLGVGFDTDSNGQTGAPCVPGGGWTCKGALGLERLLVADSTGARMMGWTGSAWQQVGSGFAAEVDATNNTVSTTVPASLLRPLTAAPTRAVGVLGLSTSSWLTGGPIYNLAYVRDQLFTGWQDATQADVLAGRRDASLAVATIDARAVASGATRIPPLRPGHHVFLYHSRLRLAEGVAQRPILGQSGTGGSAGNYYLGPYQPYGVWVSRNLPAGPTPLLVVLHGSGGTHLSPLPLFAAPPGVQPLAPAPDGTFDVPGIMVGPLARGEQTYDYGIGEQDILDVIADISRRVAVDAERVVLSGISLGSLGTWRTGELYPDRFSALVPIIAASEFPLELVFAGARIFPNAIENVRNLPVRALGGRADPLAHPFTGAGQDRDFANMVRLGFDVRSWNLLRRHHEVVPGVSNCVFLEAFRRPRDHDPARVTYTTDRALEMSDPETGLDLTYRSAYWVSGLSVRQAEPDPLAPVEGVTANPLSRGTIDVVSLARARRAPASVTTPLAQGENLSAPANVCGTEESTFQGQDTWYEQRNEVLPGPAQPVTNGLELTLTNLSAATLKLPRASVSTRAPVTVVVTGDGPATLTLAGPWSGPVVVTRDGAPAGTLTARAGGVALQSDFGGTHTFVLTPVRPARCPSWRALCCC